MKILTISREELHKMFPRYAWIADQSFNSWIEKRLLAAGFDMTREIYRDKDKDGNRVYAQKEQSDGDGVVRFTTSS